MEFQTGDITEIVSGIWTSMLGFPIEPRSERPAFDEDACVISARVLITGEWDGAVVINCTEELGRRVASEMLQDENVQMTLGTIFDAVGEVTNMTAGNVKNMISGLCRLTTPKVTDEEDYSSSPDGRCVFEASFDCEDDAFALYILVAA